MRQILVLVRNNREQTRCKDGSHKWKRITLEPTQDDSVFIVRVLEYGPCGPCTWEHVGT